ncbi:MAG: hypothetical protein JWO37_942 [Acidimicrobiales bacterium]|nr:hypothetical protein [Acidimicrobiales bacterium]
MAEQGLFFGDRAWFSDTRTPARRMAVTSHPDEGVIVVSFWQGDACTSTFRLPLADGARLISAVAGGMAAGLPAGVEPPSPPPGPSGWRQWIRAARARLARRKPPPLRVVR